MHFGVAANGTIRFLRSTCRSSTTTMAGAESLTRSKHVKIDMNQAKPGSLMFSSPSMTD
jgi:hypothetical protein